MPATSNEQTQVCVCVEGMGVCSRYASVRGSGSYPTDLSTSEATTTVRFLMSDSWSSAVTLLTETQLCIALQANLINSHTAAYIC